MTNNKYCVCVFVKSFVKRKKINEQEKDVSINCSSQNFDKNILILFYDSPASVRRPTSFLMKTNALKNTM